MKKLTKNLFALITVLSMVISLVPMTAGAAKVGDVIGYAQPTDIIATINGYQLQSYNVNGYTYICAEDLRYYGFNVKYDNSTRILAVDRSSKRTINPEVANPDFWKIGNSKKSEKIIYSDIVTYVKNHYVGSCNINGKTIINFSDLTKFGSVKYDNDKREISLTVSDIHSNQVYELAKSIDGKYSGVNSKTTARAKGSMLVITVKAKSQINQTQKETYIRNTIPYDKQLFKNELDYFKSLNWPVTSIYAEYYNKDGSLITSFQVN